jgi:hypothetical protein
MSDARDERDPRERGRRTYLHELNARIDAFIDDELDRGLSVPFIAWACADRGYQLIRRFSGPKRSIDMLETFRRCAVSEEERAGWIQNQTGDKA